jgi:hypothetical protein
MQVTVKAPNYSTTVHVTDQVNFNGKHIEFKVYDSNFRFALRDVLYIKN